MNQGLISRRYFLGECGIGLGKIAAASLLSNNLAGRSLEPKPAHSQPKAKAVIHLFMAGAPSQLELFDQKPTFKIRRVASSKIHHWRSTLRLH